MAYAHQRLSLSVIMTDAMMQEGEKNWELRLPDPNLRHQSEPRWVSHRFPIKDGKTSSEMIFSLMSEKNALLSHLLSRQLHSDGSRVG